MKGYFLRGINISPSTFSHEPDRQGLIFDPFKLFSYVHLGLACTIKMKQNKKTNKKPQSSLSPHTINSIVVLKSLKPRISTSCSLSRLTLRYFLPTNQLVVINEELCPDDHAANYQIWKSERQGLLPEILESQETLMSFTGTHVSWPFPVKKQNKTKKTFLEEKQNNLSYVWWYLPLLPAEACHGAKTTTKGKIN